MSISGDKLAQKIMITTDGSEASYHAADIGIELARQSKGKVIAIYVIDVQRLINLPGYATIPGLKDRLIKAMLAEGEEALEIIEQKSQKAGVSCDKVILRGDPSKELLEYSKDLGADILIIGSIGRTGINRFLLGSVAEKVVKHSEVPVLVVPFDSNDAQAR